MKRLKLILLPLLIINSIYATEDPTIYFGAKDQIMDYYKVSYSQQNWTENFDYEGPVVVFEAQGRPFDKMDLGVDDRGFSKSFYVATVRGDFQYSADHGIEYAYWDVRPITFEAVKELEQAGRIQLVRKGIDFGDLEMARDDSIGLKSYNELSLVKVYGTWAFKPSENSNHKFLLHLASSIGRAEVEVSNEEVDPYSNDFIGAKLNLKWQWKKFEVQANYDIDRMTTLTGEDQDKFGNRTNTGRQARDVSLGFNYTFINKKDRKLKCGATIGKRVFDAEVYQVPAIDIKARRYELSCTYHR